eukprot:6633912-Heterocapsa_arctica.AAC.1
MDFYSDCLFLLLLFSSVLDVSWSVWVDQLVGPSLLPVMVCEWVVGMPVHGSHLQLPPRILGLLLDSLSS